MFAAWLVQVRRRLGLSQRRLGELTGLSPSALGMYEQGRRRPKPSTAARLEAFFREQGLEMPPPPPAEKPEGERLEDEVRLLAKKIWGGGPHTPKRRSP